MTDNIRNVLIVTNFSESSSNAIETGIAMCKRHQASLHLLHVRTKSQMINLPGKYARLIDEVLAAYTAELKEMQLKARAIQQETNVPCYFHIAEGPFWRGISSTATDFNCDLVILEKNADGYHPAPGTGMLRRILREVNCPVLTLPAKSSSLYFKKILIPLKASYSDLKKLVIALPIIRKNNSDVFLFGSIDTQTVAKDILLMNKLFNSAGFLIKRHNSSVERGTCLNKSLAKHVIRKAAEKQSDLIILTNRSPGGIKSLFFPNTMEKVIAGSSIPVLTVKVSS